jgi:DNA-binding transcriptional MerR regulator
MTASQKSPSAFLTIGELAESLGLPQHILRYWETRFKQLKPLQRAGNRRYYRPEDAALARKINQWLNVEGYTVKGVQKLLAGGTVSADDLAEAAPVTAPVRTVEPSAPSQSPNLLPSLIAIRDQLARALAEDDRAALG